MRTVQLVGYVLGLYSNFSSNFALAVLGDVAVAKGQYKPCFYRLDSFNVLGLGGNLLGNHTAVNFDNVVPFWESECDMP